MQEAREVIGTQAPVGLLCVAVGAVIGWMLLNLPLPAIPMAIAGCFGLRFIYQRPGYGILIFVVVIASIVFEDTLPMVPIGIGSLQITDIILLMLLARIGAGVAFRTTPAVRTPLDLPLILFTLVIVYSAYNAIANYGLDFNLVIRVLRGFMYYLVFFLITNFTKDKDQVWFLLKGLFAIAVVVALSMILQSIVGDALQLVPGRVEKAGTFELFDTLRILPPGQTLIYCLLTISLCLVATNEKKNLLLSPVFYLVLVLGAGVLLTYNRTYWIAIILTAFILLAMSRGIERVRIAGLVTVMVVSALLFSAYSLSTGALSQTRMAVTSRFTSLFAGKELTDSGPIEDRMIESRYAIIKIREHPLLGNGLANDYRPNIYGEEDELQNYIHNGYLYLLLNAGGIGTLCFGWFYLAFLARGAMHVRRIRDANLRSVLTGSVLSCLGLAVMAPANPIFMQWFSVIVISILSGLSETIIRINKAEIATTKG